MPLSTLLETCAVLFFATVVRTTFGFGEALVAVPLLALVIPVQVAAPVAVLASIVIAGFVVARDWRQVHVGAAWKLVLATCFGVPLGLLLLKQASEALIKGALAALLAGYAIFSLLAPAPRRLLQDDRLAYLFGFLAGISGGSYGMNGPPLAIYGSLRGWEAERFRATLQGYFLPASLVGILGYWLTGLWSEAVTRLFVASLPAIALGILAGRFLNRAVNDRLFVRMLNFALLLIALALAAQSARLRGA